MKTLDRSSIIALISLLEDPDEIIFNEIQKTITALDIEGIIPLQKLLTPVIANCKKRELPSS
ncbi:hypothetical protein V3A08_06485 [Tenacibaculum maritimum]|uniref:hypothetical protein n=1 Tax=Tenacibaculum maritimum TaxID=107401 RepID=UPI0038776B50